MMIMPVAVAALSYTIGEAWRGAEERARILAETDPLTGIANRRTFLAKLATFAADPVATFAVLMLDLDNFKRLNDEFGHQQEDAVLVASANAVAKILEPGDVFGRYGGEDFIIALPQTTLGEAAAIGMRIRNIIAVATPTTVSIGCAERTPGESPESVIRRADELLLQAKRSGRNRVQSSSSEALAA